MTVEDDARELAEMGLTPWPHENAVRAEADVPIPGGALAVRLPAGWAPHARVEMDDGSIVFVEVPREGRRFEAKPGRRIAVVDRACLAVTKRI